MEVKQYQRKNQLIIPYTEEAINQFGDECGELIRQIKRLQKQEKMIKDAFVQTFGENNIKWWETLSGKTKITYVPPGEDQKVRKVNTEALLKDHPELTNLLEEYTEETVKSGRSAYVTITSRED